MSAKALVSVQIGEACSREWNEWFAWSWKAYAERHGYDLVIIDDWIDKTPRARSRKVHWQKLLVCEDERVRNYDNAVFLDHDILIQPSAPCIVDRHADPRVGLVSMSEMLTLPARRIDNLVDRLRRVCPRFVFPLRDIYGRAGLPADVEDYTNSGVMVLRPQHHRATMRAIYDTYEENPDTAHDEVPLAYHLFKHGLAKPIDPRFNAAWLYEIAESYPVLLQPKAHRMELVVGACINAAFHNNWFLHMTGDTVSDGEETYRLRDDVRFVLRWLDDILKLKVQ